MDILWYRFRYIIGGLLVVLLLPLFSLLPPASGTSSFVQTPNSTHVKQNFDDSPNIVTNGLAEGISEIKYAVSEAGKSIINATYKIGLAIYNGLHYIGETSASAGKSTAKVIGKIIATIAHTGLNMLGFLADTVANLFGFITKLPVLNSYVLPVKSVEAATISPVSFAVADLATLPEVPAIEPKKQSVTWPIHGNVTTLFGVPHWPFQPTHTGMDIRSGQRSGVTPIVPYKTGKVIKVVRSNSGLGNHVIVDHGDGLTSVYAHLSSIAVTVGQNVSNTSIVGHEGSTGASTGTHLHFEIRVNNQPVNPQTYFDTNP